MQRWIPLKDRVNYYIKVDEKWIRTRKVLKDEKHSAGGGLKLLGYMEGVLPEADE